MAIEQEIKTALDEFAKAWNRGDAAALANAYAEDGKLIGPFGQINETRASIQAAFGDLFATLMRDSRTSFDLESVRELAPGLVVVDANQHVEGLQTPGGAVDQDFHVVIVGRRTGDAWQLLEGRAYAFLPRPPGA
jgi:uncharacterized protein (TIGR02246 family)